MRRFLQIAAFSGVLLGSVFGSGGCTFVTHDQRAVAQSDSRLSDSVSNPHDLTHARPAVEENSDPPVPARLIPVLAPLSDGLQSLAEPRPAMELDPTALNWRSDESQFLLDFRDDVESLFTQRNAALLLAAGGVSYAFHERFDDDVAANTARHANRWGRAQDFFGGVGNPAYHLAAASGLSAYNIWFDDVDSHEMSKSLFNAVAITGISSSVLKAGANTTRPNGEPRGWPSGHTSSSMAVAAVLDEYCGHRAGVPAYLLAGLVAWERIDDREHDLSDVIFGAALGFVIGRSVAEGHEIRFGNSLLEPFVDPTTGASGVGLERRF